MGKQIDYVKYIKDLTDIDITPGANEVKLFQNGNIIDTALYKLFFEVFNTYAQGGYNRLDAIQNTINWIDRDITLKIPELKHWGYPKDLKQGKLLMLKPLKSDAMEILSEFKGQEHSDTLARYAKHIVNAKDYEECILGLTKILKLDLDDTITFLHGSIISPQTIITPISTILEYSMINAVTLAILRLDGIYNSANIFNNE